MKNDVIYLVSETISQDADGFDIVSELLFETMADVQSAKRTEYYQAASVGMNVQLVAVVNFDDYAIAKEENGAPKLVIYDGTKYKIIRTFRKGKSNDMSLTLSEVE